MARNRTIAALAASHAGAVTRAELLAAGLGPDAIDHRIESGLLHRRYRGVYILGHLALAAYANQAAALLACGSGAVLSHRSAAAVWSLVPADPDVIDVTVVGRRCRAKPGVRLHRVDALATRDVRRRNGLAVTAPARTLLDLGACASADELEQALAHALRRRVVTAAALEQVLDHAPSRRGAGRMRALLRSQADPAFTRSDPERILLALLRRAELPEPLVNVRVHGFVVDFFWPAGGLVVEVDGHAFHADRRAFERDRLRDQVLVAAGLRVIRITWRQLTGQPLAIVARIAQALRSGGPLAGDPAWR